MKTVVIYSDDGVDGGALKQLVRSLQQEIDPQRCNLLRLSAHALLNQPWEEKAVLLIIPGGRDIFYHALLDGAGTDRVRSFVQSGGNYLGICAGAYFACRAIEFEKGGKIEVCGTRSLEFFPGIAKGPAYGPNKYSYENAQGTEAAKISWQAGECYTYFNGGCLFEAEDYYPWVKILSQYLDLPGAPSAVLEIELGQGRAILSGVHVEYNPRLLNREDPHLARIIPLLENSEKLRREIFRSHLMKLGVPLN